MLTLNLILKLNILKSATASLISFTLVILAEIITVLVQTRLLNYSEEQLLNATDLSKFLFSLPPLMIIIGLAIVMQIRLYRNREDKD